MTDPKHPAEHKAPPAAHKAAEKHKPHLKHPPAPKAPVPAPAPASVPAKGLAVLSVASGLISAAVFGLFRRGRR